MGHIFLCKYKILFFVFLSDFSHLQLQTSLELQKNKQLLFIFCNVHGRPQPFMGPKREFASCGPLHLLTTQSFIYNVFIPSFITLRQFIDVSSD